MHEFSIATQIMESILEFAETHEGSEVLKVRLGVGELTCVEGEQLRFCYESITKGTRLEGTSLEIETVPAGVRCARCGYSGPPKYWDGALAGTAIPTLECPTCGKAAEAVQGHECMIKTVQCLEGGVGASP